MTKMFRFVVVLLCSVLLLATEARSQKTFFVYLQSENQQPFYVTINGKNISSSSIGYVILSKLVDSTYPIKIGFPGTNQVQEFDVKINGTDQGFMIKDFGEKGWGLFNFQSMAVEMSTNHANKLKATEALQKAEAEKRSADSLAAVTAQQAATQKADSIKNALAIQEKLQSDSIALVAEKTKATAAVQEVKIDSQVVKNSDIADSTTSAKSEKVIVPTVTAPKEKVIDTVVVAKGDTIKPILPAHSNDTIVSTNPPVVIDTTVAKTDSILNAKASVDAVVKAGTTIVEKPLSDSGVKKVVDTVVVPTAAAKPKFLDIELNTDTSGLVPVRKAEKKDSVVPSVVTGSIVTSPALPKADTGKKTNRVAGLSSNNSNTTIVVVPAKTDAQTTNAIVTTNSTCKQTATDKDFFNLRKKMVAETEVSDMILAAKKSFKEKCYSTSQVRNLCVLFLDDASRYNFLDQVYDLTYDRENYKALADLLKDDYYVRRFNAMLR